MMLRQIQHFQTVIQENSFTEAAELCHISQSGISRSIQSLEDEIGAKLIIRKNRSFELTEAGEHFYKKSLIITADLEQLCHETVRIARKDAVELRLGVLSTYSGDQFNRAVAAFSEKYPTVDIKVISGNHEDLYERLVNDRIDISLHEARMMVVTGRGIMPVEGVGGESFFGATIKRLPLLRGEAQITRKYCAFWKKDNSGYYVEEFADILESMF